MKDALQNTAFFILIACALGWLFWVGAQLLWPIFAAIICSYVLIASSQFMDRVPILQKLPKLVKDILVGLAFIGLLFLMASVISSTINSIVEEAPTYQKNLSGFVTEISGWLGLENVPTWETVRSSLLGKVDLQSIVTSTLGQLTAMGGQMILIAFYAIFLLGERGLFTRKLAEAYENKQQVEHFEEVFSSINTAITSYLTVKTLVNILLGVLSYIIMLGLGIDFAAFWAIIIGLMNYIPYVGSIVGVAFPVLLSLAQFGSIGHTLIAAILLVIVQMFVGYVVEPKYIGKSVNLSPFVVMVALSFWSAIWGLPGAILAIPLTAIISIIFAASADTRKISIFLSADGNAPQIGKEAER